jgi:ABC-type antimicrobial peptide transport system permease subunit
MGMTLFEANARIKEIGIRKVLGAQVSNIVALLTKDSFRLLVLSSAISLPAVYLLSSRWLSGYAQHIDFSLWFLAIPLATIGILVALVSFSQVIRAATRNPVESLKQE